jgi:phenylalanyl-tRNA synthetase beta chain
MINFLKKLFATKGANSHGIPFIPNPTGKIIAAKVVAVEKHPNADRLRVIKLSDGTKEIYPVVCGAFNFSQGDTVVLALPGATIAQNIHSHTHESFTLDTAKIRGVESQGMVCAAFELGLTNEPGDKPEIMVLSKNIKPGTILA